MSQEHKKHGPPAQPPTAPNELDGGGSGGTAMEEGGSELRQQITQLNQEIAQLNQEAEASRDRFLRERAELENFKKRIQREKGEALRFACEPLLRELLPVVDNLERALANQAQNGQSVLDGVRLVLKSLLEILENHGVKRIEAVGTPFDPNRHEAIAKVESAEHLSNQVAVQHQTGYQLYERLLRPALVSVSTGKPTASVATTPDSD